MLSRLHKIARLFFVIVATLAIFKFVLGADASPKVSPTIESQAFVVRSKEGKVVAVLSESEGLPGLTMFDREGNERVTLFLDEKGGSSLGFFGKGQKPVPQLGLRCKPDGSHSMTIYDQDGLERVHVGHHTDDTEIVIWDERGNRRVRLARLQGQSGITISDKNDNTRMSIRTLNEDDDVTLEFKNSEKAILLELPPR